MRQDVVFPSRTLTPTERLACAGVADACACACRMKAKRLYTRGQQDEGELYEWMAEQFDEQAESHRSKA